MRRFLVPVVVVGLLLVGACSGPELRGGLSVSACVPSSTVGQAVLFSPGAVELLGDETLDEVIISFVGEPTSTVQVGAGDSSLKPGDVYTLRTRNTAPISVRYGSDLDIRGPATVPLAVLVDVPGGVSESFDVQDFAVVINGRRADGDVSSEATPLLSIASECSES